MEYKAHGQTIIDYKLDMLDHLLLMESPTQPNLSLIQQQPEINLRMRPLLLDFLMDVINKLNLSKSTFPLTVNLIDRYCSIRMVKKQHYQLLGLTSLWIACKNLDSKFKIPLLNDLCKMCCNCYDKNLFIEMEIHVLKSLNWTVGSPTFDSFVDFYINVAHHGFLAGLKNSSKVCNDLKVLSIYMCELIQFYPNIYFSYSSSQIALVAFITACMTMDLDRFDAARFIPAVRQVTDHDIMSLTSFNQCFTLLLKVVKCPPPSLKLKYFNDDSRFIDLMKRLIIFTNDRLQRSGTQTPKFYPTTPTSSDISPKQPHYIPLFQVMNVNDDLRMLQLPKLSPADNSRGGYFDDVKKRTFDDDHRMVKRTKLMSRPVFHIS